MPYVSGAVLKGFSNTDSNLSCHPKTDIRRTRKVAIKSLTPFVKILEKLGTKFVTILKQTIISKVVANEMSKKFAS